MCSPYIQEEATAKRQRIREHPEYSSPGIAVDREKAKYPLHF